MRSIFIFSILVMSFAIFLGCSDNPVTPEGQGNLTISITGVEDPSALNKSAHGDKPTITSVRVVIEKVELENSLDASVDFKFDQPFVQDLVTITTLQEIQTLDVPFGTYDQIKIDIDDLDSQDGDVFTENPELQNLSILVQGYRNADSTQTFEFSSNLSFNINMYFEPPILINENTVTKNIVLGIDYSRWFGYGDDFLDPSLSENRARIEKNIEKSFRVFQDDDRDGKEDDHHKYKKEGVIDSLGVDHLVVRDRTFYVNEFTIIESDNDQKLTFADLQVGMCVEIYALPQQDDTLLAVKIEIEDDLHDDDCDDDKMQEDDKDGGNGG